MLCLVAAGLQTRDSVVAYFRELFEGRLERKPGHIWGVLVNASLDLYPVELTEQIAVAYEDALLDESIVGLGDVLDRLETGSTAGVAYLRVADVDALYAEVVAAGLEVLSPAELRERWDAGGPLERISALEDKPWGLREFALLDADNNLLRIGQPLP